MKLTPLNITLACILVWLISEWGVDNAKMPSIGWCIALGVLIILLDIVFRLIFKDLKRIWFLQIGFILIVATLMIILKLL